jgi:signal transduction histidine kinase
MESYPGALSQVLVNLIENAVKHGLADTTGGEVRIRAGRTADASVRISVSDNGLGIPELLTDKVFSAFFTTQADRGGTGLGLHIVKTIVANSLGGAVSLAVSDEAGARFVIDLPLRAPRQVGASSRQFGEALTAG